MSDTDEYADRPTPITDEMAEKHPSWPNTAVCFARQLEREFAEVNENLRLEREHVIALIEQRDALAEALEIIASGGRGQFRWSMTKAEWLARKALAAVKGGEG